LAYNARHKAIEQARNAAVGNVSPGIPGWRKLITGPIWKRIKYGAPILFCIGTWSKIINITLPAVYSVMMANS
jgi:hypothetical protein